LRWSFKWRKELKTGQYYDLVNRGFIKPADYEPCVDGFEFYLDAFRELSTSRPGGLDLQAIPFTAIAEYFRIYELRDFDEFAHVIRQMDLVFMDMNNETQKQGREKNDGSRNTDKKNRHKG
jgi:hypothetical protein